MKIAGYDFLWREIWGDCTTWAVIVGFLLRAQCLALSIEDEDGCYDDKV